MLRRPDEPPLESCIRREERRRWLKRLLQMEAKRRIPFFVTAGQLIDILSTYGYTGSIVEIGGILHLKTGMSYMEDNIILVHDNLADHPEFESFTKIIVPPEEAYAANAIRVNDVVLLPANYPLTTENLRRKGLKVIELPMSEFRKLDGGLSCLSLRW